MDRQEIETAAYGVAAGLFIIGISWLVVRLPARYGPLTAIYLSELQFFGVILLSTAILTWLVLCYLRIPAPLFVLLAFFLPVLAIATLHGLRGSGQIHPAMMVIVVLLTLGFLAGLALHQGNAVLPKRYPTILEPVVEAKWWLLLIAGIFVVGFGAFQIATAPTPSVADVEPGSDRSSMALEVELATDPAHYRVVIETPTGERFDEWIAPSEFRDERGQTSVQIARPNVAPPPGTYQLTVETIFGQTVQATDLTFEDGPEVVVSGVSFDEDGSIVTIELENTGDLPAPLWDHELYIDGKSHRVSEDYPAVKQILPGQTTEIEGEIGHHPHGELETVTLEPGTYEIRFELRATNRTLATFIDTVEIPDEGEESND